MVQQSTVHEPVLDFSRVRTRADKHIKEEGNEGEDVSELTSRRLIHLSQPVTPTLPPPVSPSSLIVFNKVSRLAIL